MIFLANLPEKNNYEFFLFILVLYGFYLFFFINKGVVAMHIETLEAVNRESKRLPPVQKVKIIIFVTLALQRSWYG